MSAQPHEPIAALLRELVPAIAHRCALYVGGARLAEIGAELSDSAEHLVHELRFPSGEDGELVLWSRTPLPPLAHSWARSVAAHAASLRAAVRARASDTERDRAFAMVGHELRSPLQTLVMGMDLVLMRLRATADETPRDWLLHRLEQLERTVDGLAALADRLLEASRPRAKHHAARPARNAIVDAGSVLDEVVTSVAEDAVWAACEIVVHKSGELTGRWERVQLERVLANLITNARKYGGGRPITIEVSGEPTGVIIRVRDEGLGIPARDLPHIFERFYRGENGGRASGLGVGLWIVEGLVHQLGGTIACESQVGAGTTFTVRLPRTGDELTSSPEPG